MQIGDDQRDLLEDIRKADEEAARELMQARKELEDMNRRQQAQADQAVGGARARQIGWQSVW